MLTSGQDHSVAFEFLDRGKVSKLTEPLEYKMSTFSIACEPLPGRQRAQTLVHGLLTK